MLSPADPQFRPDILTFFTAALSDFEAGSLPFSVLCTVSDPSPGLPVPPAERAPAERLIILDSSFNPPTVAHMRMVLSAVGDYYPEPSAAAGGGPTTAADDGPARDSARILLLLSVNNADKAPQPAPLPERLAMMYVFAKDLSAELPPGSAVAAVDVALGSQPYFHSKSESIAAREGGGYGAAAEQVYLAGYDTLVRIFDPKYYGGGGDGGGSMGAALGPLFGRARLRITLRTGSEWGGAREQRAYLEGLGDGGLERAGGKREWLDRIELVGSKADGDGGGDVVSSTLVRRAARRGDGEALGRLLSEGVRQWVLGEGLYSEETS